MFAANHIQGLIKAQSVGVRNLPSSGVAETPWYDRAGRWVLPGLGHLRVIRTLVDF